MSLPLLSCSFLGPVSRKSRNFTGLYRVSQFPLYLKNVRDFIVILLFVTSKTCLNIGFPKQAVVEKFSGLSRNGPRLSSLSRCSSLITDMISRQTIAGCKMQRCYAISSQGKFPEHSSPQRLVCLPTSTLTV